VLEQAIAQDSPTKGIIPSGNYLPIQGLGDEPDLFRNGDRALRDQFWMPQIIRNSGVGSVLEVGLCRPSHTARPQSP